MPSKNTTKQYSENSYYHIYNRGVEKRLIFLDEQDYGVFLSYLKEYLSQKNLKTLSLKIADPTISSIERNKIIKQLRLNNFFGQIKLLAYSLMPNHFHLFIKQQAADSMDKFMNSLCTRYTLFFNRKYKRVGPLYQDVYKAVQVITDSQSVYLTKYIHKQSLALPGVPWQARQAQPSSYPEYLGLRTTNWIDSEEILSRFSSELNNTNKFESYKSFVEDNDNTDDFHQIGSLLLEDE